MEKYDVIIVGSGISGISAAKIINDEETVSYVILEARDRIGGRIYSTDSVVNTAGKIMPVHLGANWIHSLDAINPVYCLLKHYGVQLVETSPDKYLSILIY